MRLKLFYSPGLLCERLAELSAERRRRKKLRGTVAASLGTGHMDSLELIELMRPGSPQVIYDIGANVGTWTLLAKAVIPAAQIHAFEPMPKHIRQFRERTAGVSGLHLHEACLGATTGEMTLKVTDFSDASSLLPLTDEGRKQFDLEQVDEIPLRVQRLENLVAGGGLPLPVIIKLDVLGFELEVLRGAGPCLGHARGIITEVSFEPVYQGQCLFHEVVTFLAAAGFHLRALGHGMALGRRLVQTDALFTRGGPVGM